MLHLIGKNILLVLVAFVLSACARNDIKIVDPPAKPLQKKKIIYVKEKPSATKIYNNVDKQPIFQGGNGNISSFIGNHLRYPEAAHKKKLEGTVRVSFVVNAKGKVERPEIVQSLSPECDAEVLRLVKSFPTFKPGILGGVPVKVELVYPIKFKYVIVK